MGVLICLFQERKIPYDVVPPTRWKSLCKIPGKKRAEQKENTIQFVKDKFNLDDITEDAADAIAMGWAWINSVKDLRTS
jgi:Holliday junction resolvasome RuvABC endonuclease subunit